MNNVEAIDYANSDWIEDNDVLLSRASQEFPRHTTAYKTFFSPNKPWGPTGEPILFDVMEHPTLTKDILKPGIWYYGSIPTTDHLDSCGIPPILSPFRTLTGQEFRYELWRTLFIRLRLLKFDD